MHAVLYTGACFERYGIMFGWLKRNKDKEKQGEGDAQGATDISHLSPAKQALFIQMREKRAEIGEEEIAKMAKALEMEKLKKQIKHDIDHDEDKRNRLLDEIRNSLKE